MWGSKKKAPSTPAEDKSMAPLMHSYNYGTASDVPFRHSVFMPAKEFYEKNEIIWKVLGVSVSAGLAVTASLDLLNDLERVDLFPLVARIYLTGFAVLLGMLEVHEHLLSNDFSVQFETELHLLYTPLGRSGFYVLLGVLTLCSKHFINWVVGLGAIAAGIYVFVMTKYVDRKLHRLMDSQHSQIDIKQKFHEFDKNRNGKLEKSEIYDLLKDLNADMTPSEKEMAIFQMDHERDGSVSLAALLEWWQNCSESHFDNHDTFMKL